MTSGLSEEEAKLYDRQIRLWGVDAQKRMREAKVLLVGLRGLNSEVCKNLVLAGVNSVTILESEVISYADLGSHLFLTADSVGQNRGTASVKNISILNPLVKIECDQSQLSSKDEQFFKQFTVICITNTFDIETLIRVDQICRANSIHLFIGDTFGYRGYFFEDLSKFTFVKKLPEQENKTIPQTIEYPSLSEVLSAKWSSLKRTSKVYFAVQCKIDTDFAFSNEPVFYSFFKLHKRNPVVSDEQEFKNLAKQMLSEQKLEESFLDDTFLSEICRGVRAELSPVCAVLGGILGQEIIKVISGKEEPLKNFMCYDAMDVRKLALVETIPK